MTALGYLLLNVSTAGAAVGIARLLHVCVGLRSGWVFDPLLRRARRL